MMGSSAGSSPPAFIKQGRAGAPPSCKICLKNMWTRPAGPLAAFHLPFLTQRLMIGLLRCKRGGGGSQHSPPWLARRAGTSGQAAKMGALEASRSTGSGQSPVGHGSALCREAASLHPGRQRLGAQGATALLWGRLCITQQ